MVLYHCSRDILSNDPPEATIMILCGEANVTWLGRCKDRPRHLVQQSQS